MVGNDAIYGQTNWKGRATKWLTYVTSNLLASLARLNLKIRIMKVLRRSDAIAHNGIAL